MKTPVLQDLSVLRLCNPPAFQLPFQDVARHWQEKLLGFRFNLMSIPIEPARPPFSFLSAKLRKNERNAKEKLNFLFISEFRVSSAKPEVRKKWNWQAISEH
jgi:hypothetical protein